MSMNVANTAVNASQVLSNNEKMYFNRKFNTELFALNKPANEAPTQKVDGAGHRMGMRVSMVV